MSKKNISLSVGDDETFQFPSFDDEVVVSINPGLNDSSPVVAKPDKGKSNHHAPPLPPVMFGGQDVSGNSGLWVSDGTAKGTHELTGISGANSNGLFANRSRNNRPGFTFFNGEVLLGGLDAAGSYGLWITDGTAAGTSELTGISGAYSGGLFAYYELVNAGFYIDANGFAKFNGEVLFPGENAAGKLGLWVTDGTAKGTHELTGISGAYSGGIVSSGVLSPAFTVFNSEVLFSGLDASGFQGLWVTDGTAAGTHELTGISGAHPNGIFSSQIDDNPPGFTVFNGEVLFLGFNASNQNGLWVTDGTAAGTHELSISGAPDLSPSSLMVFNNEVLFCGYNGEFGLWVTNGTAAGTHELTGISGTNGNFLARVPPDFA